MTCNESSALGLNSGIQDADNLISKIAMALRYPDMEFDRLLLSYDTERRPIGERVGKTSLYNMRSHALVLDHVIGLSPDKSERENVQAMQQYCDLSDTVEGDAKRQLIKEALRVLDVEFCAHGAELEWVPRSRL